MAFELNLKTESPNQTLILELDAVYEDSTFSAYNLGGALSVFGDSKTYSGFEILSAVLYDESLDRFFVLSESDVYEIVSRDWLEQQVLMREGL